MRVVFALLLLSRAAIADDAPQVTASVGAEARTFGTGVDVAAAVRVHAPIYLDAKLFYGSLYSEGTFDSDAYIAQFGASAIAWRSNLAGGVRASIGFSHESYKYSDVDDGTTMSATDRGMLLDTTLFGRIRVTRNFALEASLSLFAGDPLDRGLAQAGVGVGFAIVFAY